MAAPTGSRAASGVRAMTSLPGRAVAGMGVLIGGALWKFAIITRACHQQGFALAKLPRRGSGTRAAPALPGTLAEAAQ